MEPAQQTTGLAQEALGTDHPPTSPAVRCYRKLSVRIAVVVGLIGFAVMAVVAIRWEGPEARFEEGMEAVRLWDFDASEAVAVELAVDPQTQWMSDVLRGFAAAERGDWDTAIQHLSPEHARGRYAQRVLERRAEGLYRTDRLKEADQSIGEALTRFPESTDLRRVKAGLAFDVGDYVAAFEQLNTLARMQPLDYRHAYLAGMIYIKISNWTEAETTLRKALRLNPPAEDRQEITSHLARTLIRQNEHAKALDALSQLPPATDVDTLRAECLWAMGRKPEARKLLQQVLIGGASNGDIELLAAQIAWIDQRDEDAERHARRTLVHEPLNVEALHLLGQALRSRGKDSEAAEIQIRHQKTLELTTRLPDMHRTAIDSPDGIRLRDSVSKLLEELGQHEMAESLRTRFGESKRSVNR